MQKGMESDFFRWRRAKKDKSVMCIKTINIEIIKKNHIREKVTNKH